MTASQSPPSPSKFVRCPGCGERLGVRDEDAGRKARCTKCGRVPDRRARRATLAVGRRRESHCRRRPRRRSTSPSCPHARHVRVLAVPDADHGPSRRRGPQDGVPRLRPAQRDSAAAEAEDVSAPAAMSGEQFGCGTSTTRTWEPGFADGRGAASRRVPPVPDADVRDRRADRQRAEVPRLRRDDGRQAPGAEEAAQAAGRLRGRGIPARPRVGARAAAGVMPVAIRDAQHARARLATTVGPDGRLIVQKQESDERPGAAGRAAGCRACGGCWSREEVIARWVMMSILFGMARRGSIFDGLARRCRHRDRSPGIFIMLIGVVGVLVLWLTFAAPTLLAVVSRKRRGPRPAARAAEWSPFDWLGDTLYLRSTRVWPGAGMPGHAWPWSFERARFRSPVHWPHGGRRWPC